MNRCQNDVARAVGVGVDQPGRQERFAVDGLAATKLGAKSQDLPAEIDAQRLFSSHDPTQWEVSADTVQECADLINRFSCPPSRTTRQQLASTH